MENIIQIPEKSQIRSGTSYHERIVKTWQDLVDALRKELETTTNLTELERARMVKELLQEEDTLKYKLQALEIYLQRASAWNLEWEGRFKTMNNVFNASLKKAEEIENKTPNLQGVINIWKTAPEEKKTDNEFRYRVWATIEEEFKLMSKKKDVAFSKV